jgi:hypothetical protein
MRKGSCYYVTTRPCGGGAEYRHTLHDPFGEAICFEVNKYPSGAAELKKIKAAINRGELAENN